MRYLLGLACMILYLHSQAQPEGYSKALILQKGIKRVVGIMQMADTSHVLNGVVITEYDFDGEARCVRKKFTRPLVDVVTTSVEYFLEYDASNRVVSEVKVSQREGLTEKDRRFISMFGTDTDTTITEFYFLDNMLSHRLRFHPSQSDSTVRRYVYEDSLLVEEEQYSTSHRGELNRKNVTIRYFYDELNRLEKKERQYTASDLFSVEELSYVDDTDRLRRQKSYNEIIWNIFRDGYGGETYELEQDSLKGRIIEYVYDENGELSTKMIYPNLRDTNQVRVLEVNDEGPSVRRSKITDNVEDSILLKDGELKVFNEVGMLVKETVFANGKVKYACEYKILE